MFHRTRRDRKWEEKIYVYGRHALEEALDKAPQTIKKVYLSGDAETPELKAALAKRGLSAAHLKQKDTNNFVGQDAVHQGVIAVIDPAKLVKGFKEFEAEVRINDDSVLVLLDELTDPQNVGAIIRSAAAFGAQGVLLPQHRQAPVTGAVAKVSAGMVFSVPIVSIGNVNQTVLALKEKGFRAYGLDMKGGHALQSEPFAGPTLIIVGNEGAGIRQKTLGYCDTVLEIPMSPRCESLNASVSAAVVLYEWSKNHPQAIQ
ncbi:23S rRNA (guanosine(2251)-2'-O)-methyltransferase RlmB [Patescibacteria group bacterium]|nr:23S rRNA (guanosine(2251)-2'-O)-methyltransferase RlmB [Patescibacteria group bacterium]